MGDQEEGGLESLSFVPAVLRANFEAAGREKLPKCCLFGGNRRWLSEALPSEEGSGCCVMEWEWEGMENSDCEGESRCRSMKLPTNDAFLSLLGLSLTQFLGL